MKMGAGYDCHITIQNTLILRLWQANHGMHFEPVPAVTLQTGVQFNKLYATAEAAGKCVIRDLDAHIFPLSWRDILLHVHRYAPVPSMCLQVRYWRHL